MSTPANTARRAILGIPYDPAKKPEPQLTVQAFDEFQAMLDGVTAGALAKGTLAELNLVTAADVGLMAWVTLDSTVANNGIYSNTGTAMAAVWTRKGDLPNGVITLLDTGAGTPSAVVATSSLPLPANPGRAIIVWQVFEATGGAMTLRVNGATAKSIKTMTGNDLPEGALVPGMFVLLLDAGGSFRVVSDYESAANLARAEQEADDAAQSAAQALASENASLTYKTQAELAALAAGAPLFLSVSDGEAATTDGDVFLVSTGAGVQVYQNDSGSGDMVGWLGKATFNEVLDLLDFAGPLGPAGTGIEAGGFRYEVASSGASDEDMESQGGEKLYARPISGGAVALSAFGAVADGAAVSPTDNYATIMQAVTTCKQRKFDCLLWDGNYAFGTIVDLGSSLPVAIIGQNDAKMQAGSTLPQSVVTWIGGATPMFKYANSEDCFEGFAVNNRGLATDFIEYLPGSIRHRMRGISCDKIPGSNAFSRSFIHSDGHRMGYSNFSRMQIRGGCAPVFINIEADGSGVGITPFVIEDRCLFESYTSAPLTVVKVKNCPIDMLTIRDNTFNQNAGWDELTIVDTRDTPYTRTIDVLNFEDNEIDGASVSSGHLMFDLENVSSFNFNDNVMTGGGPRLHMANLVNSHVSSCDGNYLYSLSGSMLQLDATSTFNVGKNYLNPTNTRGVVNLDAVYGVVPVTFSAAVILNPGLVAPNQISTFVVEPTASTAWTISTRTTTSGFTTTGQIIVLRIKNSSGGTINAPTGSVFRVAGASWGAMPANGYHRDYMFQYNGVTGKFTEIFRSSADVDNA